MNIARNPRILVIDDNAAIHDDFRKVLSGAGADALDAAEARLLGGAPPAEERPAFTIDSAFQGEEGIALLSRALDAGRPYAMAFVDVRMPPGIDGIETAARLCERDPDLQIVICTACSDYTWPEMVARLGHSDRLLILKKPFDAMEVLQLACALTEKWRLAQYARRTLDLVTGLVEARTAELREANEQLHAEIAQRELIEAQLLRTQRIESIGTLAGGLAHDLNNMLNPILMGTSILLAKAHDKTAAMILSTMQASAQRAANVVRQVLAFARGASGERALLDARHLISEMRRIAIETFPRAIEVQCELQPDLWLLEADATQLRQVLVNLCINARDAMRAGGRLTIAGANFEVDENYASMVPEARAGRYVVIRVTDTGMGIPRGVLDRVFDPFFTTKAVGQGSGLGLSAVAGIVRGHGGFINVSSHVGKGTVFEVFLPSCDPELSPTSNPGESPLPRGRGELVLIVDDESAIRDVTAIILAEHGYQTLTAADGAEALNLYVEHGDEIKAVLTDVAMPFVDGVALCRALRKINPEVKLIASTAYADDPRSSDLRSLALSGLLPKPYSTGRLLVLLRDTLVTIGREEPECRQLPKKA